MASHLGVQYIPLEVLAPDDLPAPFVIPLSAASLFVLYSIRFCSKFGSLRYSSKAPTRDTGAYN